MPTAYRHANKRIQFRAAGGRFRSTTLADVGIGGCCKCRKFFVPRMDGLDGVFPDPRQVRERQTTCPDCLGLGPEPKPAELVPPETDGSSHGQYGPAITIVSGSSSKTGFWRWCEACDEWQKGAGVLACIGCPKCNKTW